MLLENSVSAFFINGKATLVYGVINLNSPSFWLLIFLVVPFNKVPLFSKDLITFISFALFFASVISERVSLSWFFT